MNTLFTVNAKELTRVAQQIEDDAWQCLVAWALLGQCDKYVAELDRARLVRVAAAERSIHVRREILRGAGFAIKTVSPKSLAALATELRP